MRKKSNYVIFHHSLDVLRVNRGIKFAFFKRIGFCNFFCIPADVAATSATSAAAAAAATAADGVKSLEQNPMLQKLEAVVIYQKRRQRKSDRQKNKHPNNLIF